MKSKISFFVLTIKFFCVYIRYQVEINKKRRGIRYETEHYAFQFYKYILHNREYTYVDLWLHAKHKHDLFKNGKFLWDMLGFMASYN